MLLHSINKGILWSIVVIFKTSSESFSSCIAFTQTLRYLSSNTNTYHQHIQPSIQLQISSESTNNNNDNDNNNDNNNNNPTTNNNKLFHLNKLSHQYYALRHGQSKANISKIISSDPIISTIEHGLTEVGKQQVFSSASIFCKDYRSEHSNSNIELPVAIYSSDFTRARETAEIFAKVLKEHNIPLFNANNDEDNLGVKYDIRLRERYFGQFNGQSDANYQNVWDVDCNNPNHTEFAVESVNSVVDRTSDLIVDIEKMIMFHDDHDSINDSINDSHSCKVILVAHGDVLQILQTAFLKVDGSVHRSLEHLETATVRELVLKSNN